jgi:hypothetical protein
MTVTVKLPAAVLPAASVAEQLTVVGPSGSIVPDVAEQVGVIGPLTVSLADTLKLTAAPAPLVASAVISLGTVSVGFVVSRTVTVKLPVAVLPWVSLAEQGTVVVPRAKVLPDAGVQLTGRTLSTTSVAVAL